MAVCNFRRPAHMGHVDVFAESLLHAVSPLGFLPRAFGFAVSLVFVSHGKGDACRVQLFCHKFSLWFLAKAFFAVCSRINSRQRSLHKAYFSFPGVLTYIGPVYYIKRIQITMKKFNLVLATFILDNVIIIFS